MMQERYKNPIWLRGEECDLSSGLWFAEYDAICRMSIFSTTLMDQSNLRHIHILKYYKIAHINIDEVVEC